jgi:hypothetical protein
LLRNVSIGCLHSVRNKKLSSAAHKLTYCWTKLATQQKVVGWTAISQANSCSKEAEARIRVNQLQSISLALQFIETISQRWSLNSLAKGFTEIERYSNTKHFHDRLVNHLNLLIQRRQSQVLTILKLHNSESIGKMRENAFMMSRVLSDIVQKKHSTYKLLVMHLLKLDDDHPIGRGKAMRSHARPTVRSNSLARLQSERVMTGLSKLKRLVLCKSLEPFR